MIYVGRRYTAKVSGSVLKGAYCENCDCEYVYRMERTGEGQGSSPYYLDNAGAQRRAQEAAVRALTTALRGVEAVPCPDCGWYQSNMMGRIGGRYGWLMGAWITGLFAMLICYAIGFEPFLYATAITGLFFALWLILKRNFNPNLSAQQRVAKRPRGTPEPILRSVLEPKLKDLEEGAQESLQRAFAEIDAAKAKQAGKFKPAPLDPKAQEAAEADRKRKLRMQLGVWAVSGVVALVVIGPIASWKAESDAYSKITPSNEYAMTTYLRDFRNGKHAQEVINLRDDFRWDTAQSVANSTHTSQSLRAYLADAQNTRHRDEAKQRIKAMFGTAIQHAEELQKVDPDFANGIVAALKTQQDVDNPTITVSFEPVYKLEINEQVSAAESDSKHNLMLIFPEIQQELKDDPRRDRVVGPGYTFDPSATPQVHAMLRQRFQELVNAATGDQVVAVVEVPKGEQGVGNAAAVPAQIRVQYQISPSGKLVCYRSNTPVQLRPVRRNGKIDLTLLQQALNNQNASGSNSTLTGFVRDYRIDWSISFNVKNLSDSKTVSFSTNTFDDKSVDCVNPGDESVVYVGALQAACFKAYQVMLKKMGLH